jgi:O-antigen/teichoic acid export membrane protein
MYTLGLIVGRFLPILLSQATAMLIGLLGVKVLTNLVPDELNGQYELFLTFVQLGSLLTHAGLINHSSRFWQREREQSDGYWEFLWTESWARFWPLAVIIAGASSLYALSARSPAFLFAAPGLVLGAFAVALIEIAALGVNALERHWRVFQLRVSLSAVRTFVPLLSIVIFGASFLSLVGGFTVHAIILLVISWWAFQAGKHRKFPAEKTETLRAELRDYGRPFLYLGIGGWLLVFADRWVITAFYGTAETGQFGLAGRLASVPATMVLAFLMQWIFPKIFRESDQAKTVEDWRKIAHACDRATVIFFALGVGALIALQYVGPFLIGWLVDAQYSAAMTMLLPVGMSLIASQINQFEYLLLQGQQNSRAMVWIMSALAGVKTIGAIAAAAISMNAFLIWLIISPVALLIIGRQLIHHVALKRKLNP